MASSNVLIVPSVSSMLIKSDNLQTYCLLWVDGLVNSNENHNVQQKLRLAINNLRVFENTIECEIYIRQSKDDQILLIVNRQLGFVIVPLSHPLIQINSKYVYYLNFSRHHELASKFTKILATVTDLYELT
jgi:hypothetical protein